MPVYVGYVKEGEFRAAGTSGGLCRWLQAELLRQQYVTGFLSVVRASEPPLFRYALIRTDNDIAALPHSVYTPVDKTALRKTTRQEGHSLGMVGLPCDVHGVGRRFKVRLALICGGARPTSFLDPVMNAAGIRTVDYVDFREKQQGSQGMKGAMVTIRGDGKEGRRSFAAMWASDTVYLKGCHNCPLTFAEEADISFGDAWLHPYCRDWRGWNIIVVRDQRLGRVLDEAWRSGRIELRRLTPEQFAKYQKLYDVAGNG